MIGNPKPLKKQKKSKAIPKKIVKAVFKRDYDICQYCGRITGGLNPDSLFVAAHCHHIIKRRKIKGHNAEFLNCACHECHTRHGEISTIDKKWLNGEDVYFSGRLLKEWVER